jgi:hypothetical protein
MGRGEQSGADGIAIVSKGRIPALPKGAREWQDTTVKRNLGIAATDVTFVESPRSPGNYPRSLLSEPGLAPAAD